MIYLPWGIFILGCAFLILKGYKAKANERNKKIEEEVIGAGQSARKPKSRERGSASTAAQTQSEEQEVLRYSTHDR